jgi:hypothetical protein
VLFIATVLAAAFVAPRIGSHQAFVIDAQAYVCTAAGITAAPPSGQPSGTQVVFTATSTCPGPNPLYEFWMRAASQPDWVMIQSYGTSNQYNWNSTGAAQGIVYFGVWVKDATSTTSGFDANASMPFTVNSPCPGPTTITANPTSVAAGTHSTLTGATSCAHAGPLYEFWLRTATSDWFLARSYTTSATYDWNSTGAPAGTIYFGLWVKDAQSPTSTFDANASTTVTVTAAVCTGLTATAVPTTVVHGVGTHVTITGAATGCTNTGPLYEFWLRTPSTDWQLVQGYSTTATYDWNSTGAPQTTVYIGVWAKDSASTTASFDKNFLVTIPVT